MNKGYIWAGVWTLVAVGASMAAHQAEGQAAIPPAAACNNATASQALGVTAAATWVAADKIPGLPAFCEVSATLSPVPESRIGVVYRLPAQWNGKLLGLGGGGWAGNVRLESAAEGLKRGYATAQTDGGHASTEIWDNSWAANPVTSTDFAWRAVNRMTVAAKTLVAGYYGKPQDKAYFQGCSTGGRQGLMEAQRFPDDYDAIVAGAPVYTLQVQTSAILRNNTFAEHGAGFTPTQLSLVTGAVLKACDAADGVADGVIGAPGLCRWDPGVLQCAPGATAGGACLAPAQVIALRTLYDGIRSGEGSWAMFPLMRGGETGWSRFIKTDGAGNDAASAGGMTGLARPLFGGRQIVWADFDPIRDVPIARSSAFAKAYEAANPDLSAFFARGGRLIVWHGQNDPGPSPVGTVDYVKAVHAARPEAGDHLAAYLLPGVEHCIGGPGADRVDWLSALDQWANAGKAPGVLTATRAQDAMTRPVCPWPQVAKFRGSGEPNDPANWACENPGKN